MKILFLTSGEFVPSSRFRVLQYIPYLERAGHECVVLPSRPEKYQSIRGLGSRISQKIRRFRRIREISKTEMAEFDTVFLERELFSDESVDVEQMLRAKAKTLILDIDDGLFVLHPQKFEQLVRMSDAVVVGNRLLHEKVEPFNSNVTIIPTCVDVDRYQKKQTAQFTRRPTILGWTGTAANIEYLKEIERPLNEISRRYPMELRIIAESDRPIQQLNLPQAKIDFVRWHPQTEIDDLATFDIGLMPMPDSEWTRYKCGLKILQYMALGIPSIASPIGINADIVQHGTNGYLAQNDQDWVDFLSQLIDQRDVYDSIADAGRQAVEARYSTQAHVDSLINVFEDAIARTS